MNKNNPASSNPKKVVVFRDLDFVYYGDKNQESKPEIFNNQASTAKEDKKEKTIGKAKKIFNKLKDKVVESKELINNVKPKQV